VGEAGPPAQSNAPPRRRVLIADDHDLIRDGFRRMLGYEEDFEVVGEASNGREAVELCQTLEPDLVLMDVRMPEMDGLAATRAIKANQPEVSVLVVSTYENVDYLLEAIKAGAAGYVLKDSPTTRLVNAMRRALNGETPLNQEMAARLIRRLAREDERPPPLPPAQPEAAQETKRANAAPEEPPPLGDLTPRELEVLGLLAQGKSNPQIAQELSISRGTAKIHVQHILGKLGVSDRTKAVARASERGLLDLYSGEHKG
jgi:DNA-binding NarL/FixJ family response regulator